MGLFDIVVYIMCAYIISCGPVVCVCVFGVVWCVFSMALCSVVSYACNFSWDNVLLLEGQYNTLHIILYILFNIAPSAKCKLIWCSKDFDALKGSISLSNMILNLSDDALLHEHSFNKAWQQSFPLEWMVGHIIKLIQMLTEVLLLSKITGQWRRKHGCAGCWHTCENFAKNLLLE